MSNARLGDVVLWRIVPELDMRGVLVAWSDPDSVWVRWSSGDEERVSVDELVVIP